MSLCAYEPVRLKVAAMKCITFALLLALPIAAEVWELLARYLK